jgi:hypothetical protein
MSMIARALILAGAAAAPWSAPQVVAQGTSVGRPQAAFTGSGRPFVAVGPGTFLTYAADRVVMLDLVQRGPAADLRARFGGVGEGLRPARPLVRGRDVLRYAAATDARGDVVVAYVRNIRDGAVIRRRVVEVVRRPAGGSFGRPETIAGRLSPTAVGAAVGRGGELLVAYERGGRVEARRRPPGHGWTAPQALGPAVRGHTQIDVAAAADGTAAVAWQAQDLTEGGDNGAATLRLAVRDARGHAFHAARILESFPQRLPQGAAVDAALAADGSGVVGWTGHDGARFVARAADVHGSAARTLSAPGNEAVLGAVAAGPGGAAVAVWAPPIDTPSPQVQAAVRTPGAAAFGQPETVSPAYREVASPVVALDPRSGRALAAWLARTGERTQAVLSSLRDAPRSRG